MAVADCLMYRVAADLLQGIPVGLAFGSIPYLLRAKLSYSQIGIFSLASYPYSMKLLVRPSLSACLLISRGHGA